MLSIPFANAPTVAEKLQVINVALQRAIDAVRGSRRTESSGSVCIELPESQGPFAKCA